MEKIRENEYTKVIVLDEPGEGGACHEYKVCTAYDNAMEISFNLNTIKFQKGPIKENGVNGCQIEDLLAICIHRLEGFQAGEFPCEDNMMAEMWIKSALRALEKRTADRQKRGVEGTNQR